jgi:hypothetical protein
MKNVGRKCRFGFFVLRFAFYVLSIPYRTAAVTASDPSVRADASANSNKAFG